MQRFVTSPSTPDKAGASEEAKAEPAVRLNSEDLFRQGREVEIEHRGRIYRLRVTHSNKLILTA